MELADYPIVSFPVVGELQCTTLYAIPTATSFVSNKDPNWLIAIPDSWREIQTRLTFTPPKS